MKLASQCVLRGEFCIIYKQDLARVLSFAKLFLNLQCCRALCSRHYIFDESVFAFILDTKSDSFNEKRIRQHSFLV